MHSRKLRRFKKHTIKIGAIYSNDSYKLECIDPNLYKDFFITEFDITGDTDKKFKNYVSSQLIQVLELTIKSSNEKTILIGTNFGLTTISNTVILIPKNTSFINFAFMSHSNKKNKIRLMIYNNNGLFNNVILRLQ